MRFAALQDRIRVRLETEVCHNCIYRTRDGSCGLPERMSCPILSRVDKIVEIVWTTESDRIEPYVEKLREVICRNCRMEDENGHCPLREHGDCALDDYFALVVNIVEEELTAAGLLGATCA